MASGIPPPRRSSRSPKPLSSSSVSTPIFVDLDPPNPIRSMVLYTDLAAANVGLRRSPRISGSPSSNGDAKPASLSARNGGIRRSPRILQSPLSKGDTNPTSFSARNGGIRRSPRILQSPLSKGDTNPTSFSARNGGIRHSPRISESPLSKGGTDPASFSARNGGIRRSARISESPDGNGVSKTPVSQQAPVLNGTINCSLMGFQGQDNLRIFFSGQTFFDVAALKPSQDGGELKLSLSCQAVISEDMLKRFKKASESMESNEDLSIPLTGEACLADGTSRDESSCLDLVVSSGNFMPPEPILSLPPSKKRKVCISLEKTGAQKVPPKPKALWGISGTTFFVGDRVSEEEARQKWPHRYVINQGKHTRSRSRTIHDDDEDEIILDVKCHYIQANVRGCILNIGDCAYVKAEIGKPNYVGRILEFFETVRGDNYFRVQWFFRAEDTVMQDQSSYHVKKRIFYSDVRNDNLLDCIVSKVRAVQVPANVYLKLKSIPSCYYFYDMKYSVDYSSFHTMEFNGSGEKCELFSSDCSETEFDISTNRKHILLNRVNSNRRSVKNELSLLDLYSGCGGMSTGLCLGAQAAGVNLVARWAVDFNESACESLKVNHPETHVRNETADDFLQLLKQWDELCKQYAVDICQKNTSPGSRISKTNESEIDSEDDSVIPSGEYEVLKLVDICYGDPTREGEQRLKFKVRWKGYRPSDDTWEPVETLSKCEDQIREFVREGFKNKILPRPGDVDVVCGGPPCQGISGYNRFRNFDAPLEDDKNRQIIVFMDIVQFLSPKYVLMENVCDILKFAKATLARYALSRLVSMNYQARLGIMAAGCYGLPQFRLRVFLWGCHPDEKLPPFPLPTHDVILKYGAPVEFERNIVGYDEGQPRALEKALVLEDILSDLPEVSDKEIREQMPYENDPKTEFQKYIRKPRIEMSELGNDTRPMLYDHRPLQLPEDDYLRVCQIPRRKGANFRDLRGLVVGADNIVRLDPTMERILLPSGKPLVPDYAMNLWEGKSLRPFARLWWDETVPTVLTSPNSHIQAVLHPEQDRVLTIRETARLQGFPDYYRFCGTIKERYCQIGNAVAVPVSRALGYALGLAVLKQSGDEPLVILPPKFSHSCGPFTTSHN